MRHSGHISQCSMTNVHHSAGEMYNLLYIKQILVHRLTGRPIGPCSPRFPFGPWKFTQENINTACVDEQTTHPFRSPHSAVLSEVDWFFKAFCMAFLTHIDICNVMQYAPNHHCKKKKKQCTLNEKSFLQCFDTDSCATKRHGTQKHEPLVHKSYLLEQMD